VKSVKTDRYPTNAAQKVFHCRAYSHISPGLNTRHDWKGRRHKAYRDLAEYVMVVTAAGYSVPYRLRVITERQTILRCALHHACQHRPKTLNMFCNLAVCNEDVRGT
jgi:hypothetical protein